MPWFSDFLDDVFDGITEDLVDDILGGVKDVINDARTIEQGIAEIAKDPEFRAEVSRDVDKFLFPTDTTDHYKLTPEQASTPCTDYTPKKLLDTLNLYTGKSHAIRSHERLEETLTTACDGLKPCDFGTIYSWYRLGAAGEIWGTDLWRSLWEPRYRADAAILTTDKDDGQQYIPNPPEADPLRLWDLYSHRVITYRWFKNSDWSVSNWVRYTEYADYWAISHSWVSAHDRVNLTTPVNQEQYPVPIPEGVTLEAVRDELLGMGAQFCWLDILCLRQRYISISGDPLPGWGKKIVYGRSWPELEELRKEEWKTDIPMIGQIYEKSKQTIRWYNGLGRPFTETGWGDNRHWCNRVWTLQENSGWEDSMLTGGYPGGKLDLSTLCQYGDKWSPARGLLGPSASPKPPRIFTASALEVLWNDFNWGLFAELFTAINQRLCENPVDRVNGLNFLLYQPRIPVYQEDDTVEQAWSRSWLALRDHFKASIREELGLSADKRPTWRQLLDHTGVTPRTC